MLPLLVNKVIRTLTKCDPQRSCALRSLADSVGDISIKIAEELWVVSQQKLCVKKRESARRAEYYCFLSDQNLQNAKPVNIVIGIKSFVYVLCVSQTNMVINRQTMNITNHMFLLNLLLLFVIFNANATAVFEYFIIGKVLIRLESFAEHNISRCGDAYKTIGINLFGFFVPD